MNVLNILLNYKMYVLLLLFFFIEQRRCALTGPIRVSRQGNTDLSATLCMTQSKLNIDCRTLHPAHFNHLCHVTDFFIFEKIKINNKQERKKQDLGEETRFR